MSTPSTTNPWEETITWQPAQPVEPGEPWLVCTDDGTVGQAFMDHLDWYWSEAIQTMCSPITASVARMARLPIGPPLPFHSRMEQPPTGIEAIVCKDIAARQEIGIKKYGTTVEGNPLPLVDWLQHAYEESLDQAIYLRRAISDLRRTNAKPEARQ